MKKSHPDLILPSKWRRQFFTSIFILTFTCCQNTENINSHWHSVNPELGTIRTLDISDSISIIDRFRIGNRPLKFSRIDKKTGEQHLPLDLTDDTDQFYLKEDTLIIKYGYKYTRSNIKDCGLIDRYNYSVISISLPIDSAGTKYDSLFKDSHSLRDAFSKNLFIGSFVNKNHSNVGRNNFESLVKQFPDSVFIQTDNGVLIGYNELPIYCDKVKDLWPKGKMANLVLHVDKTVANNFLERVVNKIPVAFNLYQAIKTEDGDLGVIKIVRN